MKFDCFLANAEVGGDFLGRQPVGNHAQHVLQARRQFRKGLDFLHIAQRTQISAASSIMATTEGLPVSWHKASSRLKDSAGNMTACPADSCCFVGERFMSATGPPDRK